MVVIRLARGGAKNSPFYQVVVSDRRKPRDGCFIERVGYYNPIIASSNRHSLKLDLERIGYWISVGAQPSERVKHLMKLFVELQQQVVLNMEKKEKDLAASGAVNTVEAVTAGEKDKE